MSIAISNYPISTRTPVPRTHSSFKFELTSDELECMTTPERNKRNKRLAHIKAHGTKEERIKARERLIVENIGLATITVKKYFWKQYASGPGKPFNYTLKDDLIDVATGEDGLIKAADAFDLKEGCEFSTYAIYVMRRAVRKHLLEQHQALPLSPADANRSYRLLFSTEQQKVNVSPYAIDDLRRLTKTHTLALTEGFENTIETRVPEDDIEEAELSVSSKEGGEAFWSLPYNMRSALKKLGKKNPLYRAVFELFVLGDMTEGEILRIAKGEISPDIISNSITVAINKSAEVLKKIMSNPPKPPVIDGADFTIKDLIEALVKNPQWVLLLSENEGDAICSYYSLEETYEHECYDTVSSAIDIGKTMINEKTGELGISKQRVLQYLDTARRKLIGLYTGSYTASDAAQSRTDNFSLELYDKLLEINLNSSKQF